MIETLKRLLDSTMVKISRHLNLLSVLGAMQNHRVIHKEARVDQQQILQHGLEQMFLEVNQTPILEDSRKA